MKVLLDSNIIISDFNFKNPSSQILLENAKREKIQVYIPQIVKDEVKNKFRERINSIKSSIDKEFAVLNKISNQQYDSNITQKIVEYEVVRYDAFLNQLIDEFHFIVIPYPSTSHKVIAARAIAKTKPFKSSGVGYRDCLIWENIKTLLTKDKKILILPELFFLTANSKDFATTEGHELHPDLVSELTEEGYHLESIQLFSTLNEYIDKLVKINLEQENRLQKIIANNESENFHLKTVVSEFLNETLVNSELDSYEVGLPQEYENLEVRSVSEDFENIEISVKRLTAERFIIDLTLDTEVYFDLFIFKMDYWGLGDEDRPSILENDWNDHYMWGETNCIVSISISIIINSDMEVESRQIEKINNRYSHY